MAEADATILRHLFQRADRRAGARNLLGGLQHLRAYGPVVGMGAALELGKLSAVAQLGRRQGAPVLRCALVVLVVVVMALNSIGAYGFFKPRAYCALHHGRAEGR
jgi:hypothetical protein